MKLRRLRRIAARKNLVGAVIRNWERAQKVVTDAFARMFDGECPVTALKNSLRDMLFDVAVRPVIREIVRDMVPVFLGNAPPMTAQ
jgi:hypothetical protein